jgi:hypothetical protein
MSDLTEERLARIEVLLENLTNTVAGHQREALTHYLRLENTMYGDGNGQRGMVVRMDRLEQESERRVWRDRAIIVAVLSLLARTIVGFIV